MASKSKATISESIEKAKSDFIEFAPGFGALSVKDREDLTQAEIDVLAVEVRKAKDILAEVKTAVDGRTTEVKGAFFRYADSRLGGENAGDKPFIAYSPDNLLRMRRQISNVGGGISGEKLLEFLYERFGETPGDKTGTAWKIWEKVSDPVQTRTLNQGKLEAELTSALEHEAGQKHGSKTLYLPTEAVSAATIPAKVQASFYVEPMTKDEVEAAEAGDLL